MSRRQRRAERFEEKSEWPHPASPLVPPTVNFYFNRQRMSGEIEVPGMCVNFRHKWQAGIFLREVLEGAEEIEPGPLPNIGNVGDDREGSSLSYLVVTERDENGAPVKGRRFVGKIMGVSFEDAMKLSEGQTSIKLPYTVDQHRRLAQGLGPRSYVQYESGQEHVPRARDPEPRAKREPRENRERQPSAPRASRDGLRSLTQICAEQDIEASDVRAVLRGMKIDKPATGWAWAPDEVPAYVAKAIEKAKEKRK